ncbi:MAG: LuxR C-terminal-related transcriptional regulator [Candidatus Andeanibacterium colombiense]|uniref:LuxR C-terminal-related transcriptional regulator n=1 Tax=Candidatus Andeanibacterium colombiense TaxID=3121345 RepID=A0AAJ5X685_9SPHN|nr:MAG: LuxR C-terminal-related transcriptional regulator [Sphingomonadaceae bacterium]
MVRIRSVSQNRAAARRLAPPHQDIELQAREPLLRTLEVARRGRLTIVVGPPGYGKTTALAAWHARLKAGGIGTAWYTASDAESSPARFLRMLVLALEAGGIDPGPAALRAIADASPDTILDGILLGLDRSREPIVLIIDDFDRIDQPAIVACVEELIDAAPEHLHLVLGTRRKPDLSIAILQARGSVRLIEPGELRLRAEELAAMLGIAPDAPQLSAILARTEGWPVAVQLFRLWQQRVPQNGDLPAFDGQAPEMAGYLAEQVIAALPAEQQAALVDLSVMDQIESPLADAIRDAADSAALLERIAGALPGLVQRIGPAREVAYRVHPLLADYARYRLTLLPGRAATLHRRAAEWLFANERYADAVRHAVASVDSGCLRSLVERLPYRTVFLTHGVGELRAILREVPASLLASHPRVQLMNALALFKEGFFHEAEQMRSAVSDGLDRTVEGRRLLVDSRALRVMFSTFMEGPRADYVDDIDWVLAADPGDALLWGFCENCRFMAQQEEGSLDIAEATLERTRRAYQAATGPGFGLRVLSIHRMLLMLAAGQWQLAQTAATELLEAMPQRVPGEQSLHAMAGIVSAWVNYQRSFRPDLSDTMRIALAESGRGEAWYDQYAIALPVIVEVTFRRHGLEDALHALSSTMDIHAGQGLARLEGIRSGLELTLRIRAGALDGIGESEAACRRNLAGNGKGQAPWREREIAWRGLGKLALLRGDVAEAEQFSELLIIDGRRGRRQFAEVQGLILRASIHEACGRHDAAGQFLGEALLTAAAESAIAVFAEEGPAILPVLQRLSGTECPKMVKRHIAAIVRAIENERQLRSSDALSDREAEIVAQLANGASNKLIARRLGVTENTVKFHLKNIFAKLGVSSRNQIVAHVMRERRHEAGS